MEEFIPPSLKEQGGSYVKATETMDVWFDSGSSWTLLKALGLSSSQDGRHLPAWSDIALEGSDQHRGWFQSLLLTSLGYGHPNIVKPYHTVITHGFVLDEERKKMSKSVGNIIDPMTIIHGGKVQSLLIYRVVNLTLTPGSQEESCLWRGRAALMGCINRILERCQYRFDCRGERGGIASKDP